mgnify:CR=1 FL=1
MKVPDVSGISFDVNTWKIKVRDRRNDRMRIQMNLNKDEALAYKNFADVCRPEDTPDSEFMKVVFLHGIEAMNKELADLIKKYAKENKEDLATSGITVLEDEDGDIRLADTTVIERELSGAAAPLEPTHFLDKAQTADKIKENILKEK